jgi:hypothetical protein
MMAGSTPIHSMTDQHPKPPRPPSPARMVSPQQRIADEAPAYSIQPHPTITEPKSVAADQDLILTSSVSFHKQTSPVHPKPQSKTSPIIPKQSPTPSTTSISKMNGSPQLLVTPQFQSEKPLSPKLVEEPIAEAPRVEEDTLTHDPFAQIAQQEPETNQQTDAWNWKNANTDIAHDTWDHQQTVQEGNQQNYAEEFGVDSHQHSYNGQYGQDQPIYEHQQDQQDHSQHYADSLQYPNGYPQEHTEDTHNYAEGYENYPYDQQYTQGQVDLQYQQEQYQAEQQQYYSEQYSAEGLIQNQFESTNEAYFQNYSETAQPSGGELSYGHGPDYAEQYYQPSPSKNLVPDQTVSGQGQIYTDDNGNQQWNQQESTELDAYTYETQGYPMQTDEHHAMQTSTHGEAFTHEEYYTEQTYANYNDQNYEKSENHVEQYYQEDTQQWQYDEQYQESYLQPLKDEGHSLVQGHGLYSTETLLSRNSATNSEPVQPYKFCTACSKTFDLDSNFCHKCGNPLQLVEPHVAQIAEEPAVDEYTLHNYQEQSGDHYYYGSGGNQVQDLQDQPYEQPLANGTVHPGPELGDPLGRDRGHCVFAFGFGGQMIVSFPIRQNLYHGTELIEKCYPGPLNFQEAAKCIDPIVLQECVDAFGTGPLCSNSKPNAQALFSAIEDLIKKFQNRNPDVLLIMHYFKSVILVDK